MRLFVFMPFSNFGGVEKLTYKLIVGFLELDIKVTLVTLFKPGYMFQDFKRLDINIKEPNYEQNLIKRIFFIRRCLDKNKVLLMPLNYSFLVGLTNKATNYYYVVDRAFGKNDTVLNLFKSFTLKKCKGIIFSYNYAMQAYKSSCSTLTSKVTCIYHPVESTFFSMRKRMVKYDFIYAGRLEKEKGVMFILQALTYLSNEDDYKPSVIILGDGSLKSDLVNYCKSHNLLNVIFTGTVANVDEYFEQS